MSTKTIQIKCKGASELPLDLILSFQAGLKKLSKKNLDKLKKNILLNGFVAPIFVWDDKGDYKIIDGHGRLAALISLRKERYDIPLIPVDFIHAENEAEAKKILLSVTSQYGEFDLDELNEWVDDVDKELKDLLRFADNEIILSDVISSDGSGTPVPVGLKISITCETQDQVTDIIKYLTDKQVSFKVRR